MLPAGAVTEKTVVGGLLGRDDIIIDGGNSFLQGRHPSRQDTRGEGHSLRRLRHVGGVWGIERGYCMMIGGDKEAVDHLDPIFSTLAPGPGDIARTPGREKAIPAPSAATSTAALPAPATS